MDGQNNQYNRRQKGHTKRGLWKEYQSAEIFAAKPKPIEPAEAGEDLHHEALERFSKLQADEKEGRELAIKDLEFVTAEDGQWEESIVEARGNRPRYTIDRVTQALNQIIGDQRQNRTSIKVLPQNKANEKLADVYTGLIREIENRSQAESAYDVAFNEALICGIGALRVYSDYVDNEVFDQDLVIEPIHSGASSVYFDPDAIKPDSRDANYCFVVTRMTKEQFEATYPKAACEGVDVDKLGNDWFAPDLIQVAEYWYKERYKKRLAKLSDGTVIDLAEEADALDEMLASGLEIVQEREAECHKVMRCVISGAEVIEKPAEWPGKFIPIVPVWGHTQNIEGKRYFRGIVRKAKDPQRVLNYALSAAVEAVAMAPKNPWFYTPAQIAGHDSQYANFPTSNSPFLPFNPDPLVSGPPQRGQGVEVPTALLSLVGQAAQDVQATTGLEPASLGNVPELKSGKAIQAQQAMGDRGSFLYQDNLRKSIQLIGEILVDLIPRIYDGERVIKTLGEDGTGEIVEINKTVIDSQTGRPVLVNDLSQGRYSVVVSSGPAYATKRKETADQLIQLVQADPSMMELARDILIESLGLVGGEEINKRLRLSMLQKGTPGMEPTDEEKQMLGIGQQQQPDPLQVATVENIQMQTAELKARIENKDADTAKKIAEGQQVMIENMTKMLDAIGKKLQIGMPATAQDAEIIEGGAAIVQQKQFEDMALMEAQEQHKMQNSQQAQMQGNPMQIGQPPLQPQGSGQGFPGEMPQPIQ